MVDTDRSKQLYASVGHMDLIIYFLQVRGDLHFHYNYLRNTKRDTLFSICPSLTNSKKYKRTEEYIATVNLESKMVSILN